MKSPDELYMLDALRLAKKGMGWTFPNPMVGAVLVKKGRIIGRGYHKKVGMPHAEIEAFNNASENPSGATMYVTLEPCSHYGRTPPCVDEIIKRGIVKVVCAIEDPDLKVHGAGLKILKNSGILIETGLLAEKARLLNESFFTFHQKKRPFLAIKFASSLDGKIATKTGDSKWITNEKARSFARRLRGEYQAILVGINTVLLDNPNLGVKQKGTKDPLRIILDSTLKTPLESEVLRDTNVLIITTKRADKKRLEQLQKKGIAVLQLEKEKILIPDVIKELYTRQIVSVFVEGGAETLGSFVDTKMVDRVYAFYAPLLIGGRDSVSVVKGEGATKIANAIRLENISYRTFDDNLLLISSR